MTVNDSDKLDRLLRRDAASPIADDGFTAHVMGSLPVAPSAPRAWLTPALVLGSSALGSALAWLFAPDGLNMVPGFVDLASFRGLTPAAVTGLTMFAVFVLSAIVLAVDTE
jgi:hypothetical protein